MGMAASQARLLSITSRMSDNELRAQIINNNKIRLASESSQVSERYITALNDAKYKFSNYDSDNNINYTNLTFNALTAYNAYNNQYALKNSGGKILVSEKDAKNFEAAKTTSDPLTNFLKSYGLEKTTSYFDNLETNDLGHVMYTTTVDDGTGKVVYTSSEFTPDELKAAYTGSSVGDITTLSFEGSNGSNIPVSSFGYDDVLNSTLMNEYISNLSLYLDKLDIAQNSATDAAYTSIDNVVSNKNIYGKKTYQELFDYINESKTTTIDGKDVDIEYSNFATGYNTYDNNKVNTLIDNISSLFTAFEDISNEQGVEYVDNAITQLNEIKTGTTKDEKTEINPTKVDNNGKYKSSSSYKYENGVSYDVEYDTNNTGTITLKIHTNEKDSNGDNTGNIIETEETLAYESTIGRYVKRDASGNEMFRILPTPVKITFERTKVVTGKDKISDTLSLLQGYHNAAKKYINSSVLAENSTSYSENIENLISNANALYKVIYGGTEDKYSKNSLDGPPSISFLGDISYLYANQGANGIPNFDKDFYKIYMNIVLDNVMNTYGEPKMAWCNTKDVNDNGEAKAQWYTNLFNRINQCGYSVLKDGLASSEEWIKFAFESGLVIMEQVDSYNNWNQLTYNNCSDITEQTDEKAVTIAEAEYNAAMNKIENKDKKYDLELKNIDTEHNSLQTEYDSIKSAMDKNIERTFKLYG